MDGIDPLPTLTLRGSGQMPCTPESEKRPFAPTMPHLAMCPALLQRGQTFIFNPPINNYLHSSVG
jgi:hypothetical protein